MKQKLLALVCALSLMVTTLTTSALAIGDPVARSGDTLYTLGLLDAPSSGYDLNAPPTRLTGVELLVRLAGAEEAAAKDNWISGFWDIPAWAETSVNYAAHQGWIRGTGGVSFQGESALTANTYCTMVLRMLGYDDKAGDFSVDSAALFAQRLGVLRHDVVPTGTLTVGDLFDISLQLLSVTYKGSEKTVLDTLLDNHAVSAAVVNALALGNDILSPRQAADRYSAAVLALNAYHTEKSITKDNPDANATAFFISPDGLAVTNYHSIESALKVTATLTTGEVVELERVLYYDVGIDIAVVQLAKPTDDSLFPYFDLLPRSALEVGDPCYTISNPLGLGISFTTGTISALAREAGGYDLDCIVSTADISKGSSGGVLMNVYGQAVGVTAGAYSYGNSMYLAVPLDPVLEADLTVEGLTLPELVEIEHSSVEE